MQIDPEHGVHLPYEGLIADGGPAFACDSKKGMSLRDYFAGQALLGMNANPDLMEIVTSAGILDGTVFEKLAEKAYKQADAMLKERMRT